MLRLAPFLFFVRMPADCRGIEEHLCSLERRETRAFRIPLIPAHKRPDLSLRYIEDLVSEIARREIELLVVERVVRDVHLAINPAQRSVLAHHSSCVVINTRCAPLE